MSLLEFSTTTSRERKEAFTQARQASELMKALSHEARLLILCLLVDREKSVSEIEEFMDMPQAAVSQHLARLRLDGLVDARRDGRNIYYSLASEEVKAVIGTLHRLYCKPQRSALRRRA
jgi:DNA-binding transcriptional ArsR family regulator